MRLLVTGGAGFIGSNYVRLALSESDDHVTVYDALTYAGSRTTLADVEGDPRVTFVAGDVCDRPTLRAAMAGHDAVIHFAAETHVDRSIVSADEFVRTNCLGTQVVGAVAREVGIERLVHISTDEVYGSIEEGASHEDDRLDPRSPYSSSKAGADLLALSHHATHGLDVVVCRSSNNFGPYQFPEKIVPLFTTNLLDGRPVPLYGDGGNRRDWCHVDDNCRAVDLVLRRGRAGEIYNIGAGNELTNRDLSRRLVRLCEADESLITRVADRPGHDRRYCVDSTKITNLGWTPARELDEGLAATVAWYRDNRWWWEPLKRRGSAQHELDALVDNDGTDG